MRRTLRRLLKTMRMRRRAEDINANQRLCQVMSRRNRWRREVASSLPCQTRCLTDRFAAIRKRAGALTCLLQQCAGLLNLLLHSRLYAILLRLPRKLVASCDTLRLMLTRLATEGAACKTGFTPRSWGMDTAPRRSGYLHLCVWSPRLTVRSWARSRAASSSATSISAWMTGSISSVTRLRDRPERAVDLDRICCGEWCEAACASDGEQQPPLPRCARPATSDASLLVAARRPASRSRARTGARPAPITDLCFWLLSRNCWS